MIKTLRSLLQKISWPKYNHLLSFANILPTFLPIKPPFGTASGRAHLVAGWDVAQ